MIVTVGNTKGGVGKTTIAVNLAIARALAGRDVWLIDGDRQGPDIYQPPGRSGALTRHCLRDLSGRADLAGTSAAAGR